MNNLKRFWKLPENFNYIFAEYEEVVENMLYERYKGNRHSFILQIYYQLKPTLPRDLQIMLRQQRAKRIQIKFPNWPIEDRLEILKKKPFEGLIAGDKIPFIWFWPNGKRFAFVITHDVETANGLKNIEKICEIEKKYHLRSSWNFVAERYKVPEKLICNLKEEGFEVGVHGLKHDGRLFSSKRIFDERMKKIKKYSEMWEAIGFRSPSLLRNAEWISKLPFEYDSSFPDTDPYEPQPGGCISIYPYFLGNVIELPITLAQDHTLFDILEYEDISIWKKKVNWVEKMNGMALLLTHPDYICKGGRLKLYEEFLKYVLNKDNVWYALPVEVCTWWRERDNSLIKFQKNNTPFIEGPVAEKGIIKYWRNGAIE